MLYNKIRPTFLWLSRGGVYGRVLLRTYVFLRLGVRQVREARLGLRPSCSLELRECCCRHI